MYTLRWAAHHKLQAVALAGVAQLLVLLVVLYLPSYLANRLYMLQELFVYPWNSLYQGRYVTLVRCSCGAASLATMSVQCGRSTSALCGVIALCSFAKLRLLGHRALAPAGPDQVDETNQQQPTRPSLARFPCIGLAAV